MSGNLFQNFSLYFSEMSNNVSAVWGSEHDMSSNGFLKSLWIILGISLFVYIVTKVVYQTDKSMQTVGQPENGQTKEAGYIRINIKSVCPVPETAHVSVFFQQSYLQNKL